MTAQNLQTVYPITISNYAYCGAGIYKLEWTQNNHAYRLYGDSLDEFFSVNGDTMTKEIVLCLLKQLEDKSHPDQHCMINEFISRIFKVDSLDDL